MFKRLFLLFTAFCVVTSGLCPCVYADSETEVIFEDKFESYGVNGSGKDEGGKTVNPVKAEDDGGWFGQDASAKRGVLITEDAADGNHYMALYKQNNITNTNISAAIAEPTLDGRVQYTYGMRIYLPEAYGYYAAAGCEYKISAKETAESESGVELAALTVSRDSASLRLGGTEVGKNIAIKQWYDVKTVIALDGEDVYISTYVDDEEYAAAVHSEYTAADVKKSMKYMNISADFSGILDVRSKATAFIDDISVCVSPLEKKPLSVSFSPQSGSRVSDPSAPLEVSFNDEINPVSESDITIDGGAAVQSLEMNDNNTGFTVRFGELTEGRAYTVSFFAGRADEEAAEYTYTFTYTGNREVYVADWFNTYGVDGSGIDENGKTINPISANETYGKWYNREAASKRGAVIMQDENGVPVLNFLLQSQNKVIRTQMSSLLRTGGEKLGEPQGIYEINSEFTIPYGTSGIKAVGLRGDCYANIGLSSANGGEISIFKIDYDNGKNRIRFFDSEKSAPISENRAYKIKVLIYPKNGSYTADAYVTDDYGTNTAVLSRENIGLDGFTDMSRLTVDVNGYDSDTTARVFMLHGIDFACCYTPKLLSCDAAFKKISLGDNVITAEFDTEPSGDVSAYGISGGASILAAEVCGYEVKLTIDGLKNGESYTLSFEGVTNSDGYGCLDTVVFEVEREIEVGGISLSGGKVTVGENTVTVSLENTTDKKLSAVLVVLLCTEKGGSYRIDSVITEKNDDIQKSDSISASFTADSTQNRRVKVFLLNSENGMTPLCDEAVYH